MQNNVNTKHWSQDTTSQVGEVYEQESRTFTPPGQTPPIVMNTCTGGRASVRGRLSGWANVRTRSYSYSNINYTIDPDTSLSCCGHRTAAITGRTEQQPTGSLLSHKSPNTSFSRVDRFLTEITTVFTSKVDNYNVIKQNMQ